MDKQKRRLLLDLFCGAGGCSVGYNRAGFDVIGVDIKPQKRYPLPFVLGDALDILARLIAGEYIKAIKAGDNRWRCLSDFDAIHASPPCQCYSVTAPLSSGTHPALVEPVRELLAATGKPYVIENVPGAPLENALMLCGTMFGLRVIRHRLFECKPPIFFAPGPCQHIGGASGNRLRRAGITRTPGFRDGFAYITVAGNNYLFADGAAAMDIDWMSKSELTQAIPPAYTEYIGRRLMESLDDKPSSAAEE